MHVVVRMPRWERVSLAIAVLIAAALWAVTAPPTAMAAPPSNIWDLTTLQTHLDGGSVQGYFLTVLGGATEADQTPVAIPATIESIVPAETQDGALILFSATGATITDIGGIAAGMSGSPLYVGDPDDPQPATDPLVGAVSYGDIFTTGGLGLATPIEYMIAIQTSHATAGTAATPAARAESVTLARPVKTSSTSVRRVVVAASAAKARSIQATSGTAVFAPLDVIEIGGLSARSRLFKQTASRLEAAGYQVVAAPAAGAAGAYDPDWSTPLVAGGSLGTVYSVGDLWIGAAGTVTYVDGSTVMAYGHPLDWLGSSTAYLTNAWVSGIWHTSMEPYKLMAVAATQGMITQDRGSGVEGVVGTLPAETTVSASATFGGKTVLSASRVPQAVVNPVLFYDLPVYAAQVPIYRAIDAGLLGGSATTTSTVVVNDGTSDYTVTINNVWDDPYDVTWETTNDIDAMLYTLTQNADGIAPATIKSVDFSTLLSAQRNEARIVTARVPGGLKIGANDVIVTLAEYGVKDLQTAHVTLTLPAGTPLGGGIEVYGAGYYGGDFFRRRALRSAAGGDRRSPERGRSGRAARAGAYQQRHHRRLRGQRSVLDLGPRGDRRHPLVRQRRPLPERLPDAAAGPAQGREEALAGTPDRRHHGRGQGHHGVPLRDPGRDQDDAADRNRPRQEDRRWLGDVLLRAQEPHGVHPLHRDLGRRRRDPRRHGERRRQGEVK